MEKLSKELDKLIDDYRLKLKGLKDENASLKPSPEKWSKKEIIGHLVDSAQNNLRRFIVTQYEEKPKIVYQQDFWVKSINYKEWDLEHLIHLWYFTNKQIVHVLENMPAKTSDKLCETQALHSLSWLATDYILHLKHHLHQVLELEEIAYP